MIDEQDLQGYRRLATRAEARAAFDRIVSRTQRSLCIADDRGVFLGLDRKTFADSLEALLGRARDASVRIVVHDASFIEQSCPRLLRLLQVRSSQFAILRSDESVRGYPRAFVLADDTVVLRRPHHDSATSFVDFDEAAVAQAREVIDELVAGAMPAVRPVATGL